VLKDRYEIDFVIRENRKIAEIIQVTHDEDGIREREVSNGWEAAGELNAERLTVITWYHEDEEVRENIRIHYIPLWKWVLKRGIKK
jgi:predicted AAA+ superfamily ATPase